MKENEKNEYQNNIGKRLKKLREEYEEEYERKKHKLLTDAEFEKRLNVTRQTYKNYENGKNPMPFNIVIDLSNFYKVPSDYILCRTNVKNIAMNNINKTTGLDDIAIKALNKNKDDVILLNTINFLLKNLEMNIDKNLRTKEGYSRESIIRLISFYLNSEESDKEFALTDKDHLKVDMDKGKFYGDISLPYNVKMSEINKIKLLELESELMQLKKESRGKIK
ncbi:MAG: Helix-turn-helix domain [Clostridia bacterium]|nr:Helix-turn-helix domain [Clostridia bacterium]